MAEFLRVAARELKAAAAWYERQRSGLGDVFLREVGNTVALIDEAPLQGVLWIEPQIPPGVRRRLVPKFPYAIAYVTDPELVVVAVAHMSRRPGYWVNRKTASRR